MEQQPQPQQGGSAWASEFTPRHADTPQMSTSRPQTNQQSSYTMGPDSFNYSMPYNTYSHGYQGMSSYQQMPNFNLDTKGKGKASEADFEAAFAKISAAMNQTESSSARIVEIKDGEEMDELDAKLKRTSLDDNKDPLEALLDNVPNGGDTLEDMASWEAQFNEMMASHRQEMGEETDYTRQMQEAWERGVNEDPLAENAIKFDDDGIPILAPYEFEKNNPFMDPSTSTRSPLADAKMLLEQNGSLSEAALLLEAAIQKGELGEGGYEAWILLGETRNMDEREDAGMKALSEGVRLAESAGGNGAGMLSLAISFTNESYDRGSYSTLLRWIQTRFPDHPIPPSTIDAVKSHSTWDTHDKLTEVFIDLARKQHHQGVLDPDTQIALGVLFYTNQAYDRAKDCFEAALTVRPNDFLLWNRYGSCLSNGAKPEEALHAYREALNLRPTYTRAVYNVGVACLNIGAHKEAAEHFLSALSLQESNSGDNKGVQSDGLWFILRRALLLMDRTDLAGLAKVESRPDLEVFRKEGFEF
jgi:peroxin-5